MSQTIRRPPRITWGPTVTLVYREGFPAPIPPDLDDRKSRDGECNEGE